MLGDVKDILRLQTVGLALRSPLSLDSKRRDIIIGEYMTSQPNLLCILSLKLGPLQCEHYMLAAVAHNDPHVSRSALERCIACKSQHALMVEFQSGELLQGKLNNMCRAGSLGKSFLCCQSSRRSSSSRPWMRRRWRAITPVWRG